MSFRHWRRAASLAAALMTVPYVCAAAVADCEMSFNDQTVDAGRISGAPAGAPTGKRRPIVSVTRMLSIVCPADAVMRVHLDGIDRADGSRALGAVGAYTLTVTDLVLDGRRVEAGFAPPGTDLAEPKALPLVLRGGAAFVPLHEGQPQRGKRLDVAIRVDVHQGRAAALNEETFARDESQFRLTTH